MKQGMIHNTLRKKVRIDNHRCKHHRTFQLHTKNEKKTLIEHNKSVIIKCITSVRHTQRTRIVSKPINRNVNKGITLKTRSLNITAHPNSTSLQTSLTKRFN